MEKYAWCGKIKEGAESEYIKRHDKIWEEMKEVLEEAGIINYTIWLMGTTLFGYYECEKGIEYALAVQENSPIVDKWNIYMDDILTIEKEPNTGETLQLKKVFEFR